MPALAPAQDMAGKSGMAGGSAKRAEPLHSGKTYTELKDLCIWTKTNAGMGSFYRSQHELVFVFKNGGAPHVNTMKSGRRDRSNVWPYPSVNTVGKGRNAEHGMQAALVDEALADLLEKRRQGRPRAHIMAAYQASHEKFGPLYKKLAE